MKATQITHIEGLSGEIEMLALEIVKAEQLANSLDDDGCNADEEEEFYEAAYLDDVRQGAGYESEWTR